ncbi:hypothetical protein GTA08_BOTSDO04238 [Neofusicoccum parvum]|nr:hypothetical protein GTA08_BOTSDO04238 [Neofusicoccum parvum]
MSDLNTPRPSGFQILYDAMGIPQGDQEAFDKFCDELKTKLIDASDREHQLCSAGGTPSTRNTPAHRSTSDNASEVMLSGPVFPPDDISSRPRMPFLRRNAIALANLSGSAHSSNVVTLPEDFTAGTTTSTASHHHNAAPQAPTTRTPQPGTWAALKPTHLGRLHFPGHAHYRDFEIPITGTHGFLLLHRRPRFTPGPRFLTSRDGQPLDQHAMTTLHYTSAAQPGVQTHAYGARAALDFGDKNDVRRLEYWARSFLARHGVAPARGEAVPYVDAERDWIARLFAAEPALGLRELAGEDGECAE